MTASFVNLYDGRPTTVEVSGKYTTRDASIRLADGRILGHVYRSGGDQYTLEVSNSHQLVNSMAYVIL